MKKFITITTASQTETAANRGLWRMTISMIRPYSKWLFIILAAMLLETGMHLLAPWPLKVIIDNVLTGHALPPSLYFLKGMGATAGSLALAAVAAAALLIFTLLGAVGSYVQAYFTESVAQYVANDLRQKIYHHLHRLSLSYYDKQQVAKILNTITADVSTVQDFASSALLKILIDVLTISGMLVIMFYLNWSFALIALSVMPFLFVAVAQFKKMVKKATREVRKDQSNMAAVIQSGLESMRVVNAFDTQELEEEKLRRISMETVQAALKARRMKALLAPVISIVVAVCVAIILWRGSGIIMAGGALTIGSLTVFLAYLNKFFSPVQDLGKLTTNLALTTVALERIRVILNAHDIIPEKKNAIAANALKGEIKFCDVSFSYNTEMEVLHRFNLYVKPGERIGICGPTGSGKTTVASLIPRFYDITEGELQIDGRSVSDYQLHALRKQISFVLQDTVLFYGSIRENIAYGCPSAMEKDIMEAARLANADEFIDKMPQGFDTLVGEKGYTLSGGQRQRIGIARAIIRKSPILILDEPTASLDNESENSVIAALENLMQGKTVIIIAHRLSTILHAHRIVVMKEGRVVEEGPPAALLESRGIFFELFHLQQQAFAGEQTVSE
ncbi:MAG: ABC transporter ATP-binding protein [Flavisolibacter sp.]